MVKAFRGQFGGLLPIKSGSYWPKTAAHGRSLAYVRFWLTGGRLPMSASGRFLPSTNPTDRPLAATHRQTRFFVAIKPIAISFNSAAMAWDAFAACLSYTLLSTGTNWGFKDADVPISERLRVNSPECIREYRQRRIGHRAGAGGERRRNQSAPASFTSICVIPTRLACSSISSAVESAVGMIRLFSASPKCSSSRCMAAS